jgi:hypothetical protein
MVIKNEKDYEYPEWFNFKNNENLEGNAAQLDDWLDNDIKKDDLLGVVAPIMDEDDMFLGR